MKFVTPEISWHSRDPLYSVDLQPGKGKVQRLATCGTDKLVRIWEVKQPREENIGNACSSKDRGHVTVEFLSSLNRHSRTVNVVRFSPDDSAIILWRLSDVPPSATLFQDDEEENRETWNAFKVLRSHLEDVYDICWSSDGKMLLSGSVDNTAILWDIKKGHKLWMFSEHKSFVQGVAFDPLCGFVATMSDDRSCRIYSFEKRQLVHDVRKLPATLMNTTQSDAATTTASSKTGRMFHSADTMKSFFRRLSFSPDGQLLVAPAGCIEATQSLETVGNTTYVFVRSNLSKPVMSLTGPMKPTLAVRFCPVLFELRKIPRQNTEKPADGGQSGADGKENEPEWSKYETLFKLPYRMIYAVVSENAVILYDTQQPQPFAYLSNLHYHTLSDASWSQDGRLLVVSSTDGYCTLVSFDAGELGTEYEHSTCEVLAQSACVKKEEDKPAVPLAPPVEAKPVIETTAQPSAPAPAPAPGPAADPPVNHTVPQMKKPDAPKPAKRCITKLLTEQKSAAVPKDKQTQVAKNLPLKPNLLQPTISIRRLTPVRLTPISEAKTPGDADHVEPMDTGEDNHPAEGETRKADDTAKRLSLDSADLHLELELTNDACTTVAASAVTVATSASVLTSPGVPSLSSAAAAATDAAASAGACQSTAKNPRRIQLTTITTLR